MRCNRRPVGGAASLCIEDLDGGDKIMVGAKKCLRTRLRNATALRTAKRLQSPFHFGDACIVAWYSGFLWYSTSRKPQPMRVEKSLVVAFFPFRNFAIRSLSV